MMGPRECLEAGRRGGLLIFKYRGMRLWRRYTYLVMILLMSFGGGGFDNDEKIIGTFPELMLSYNKLPVSFKISV